ncbi:hypothetical protein CBH84_002204 [Salmonella enterica]|nr:hypothetical protein [Salmonella enterica]
MANLIPTMGYYACDVTRIKNLASPRLASPRRGFLLWIPDANKTKCGE